MAMAVLPAKPDAIGEITAVVLETCSKAGLSPAATSRLRLAVEELAVNIITHGVGEATEPVADPRFVIQTWISDDTVWVQLTDSARPFDPTGAPEPDVTADLARREVGGLGIHLVRSLVDDFTYRRLGGRNVVRVGLRLQEGFP
ncbi:hypothetical protein GCM10027059_14000 [Myceligenerans halotolerans]